MYGDFSIREFRNMSMMFTMCLPWHTNIIKGTCGRSVQGVSEEIQKSHELEHGFLFHRHDLEVIAMVSVALDADVLSMVENEQVLNETHSS